MTFVLHTQNSTSFVLRTQKSGPKSRPKKCAKKKASKKAAKNAAKNAARNVGKSVFLNLSCCGLETGLKLVLLQLP